MPYDPTDPRSGMATAAAAPAPGGSRSATYREFRQTPADEHHAGGGATWWTRSQALVVAYSEAQAGDRLDRVGQVDEYVVLIPNDGTAVTVSHGGTAIEVAEPAVVIVPPGDSTVTVTAPGIVTRVFAATDPALTARCTNDADYAEPDSNVAPFTAWPDPPAGHALRVYPFAAIPTEPGRFGRIFRCSTVMVNLLTRGDRARDPRKLSPHHHDDFEQISLQIEGDYVHHMRTAWTPDSTLWRDDQHQACASPAVVVIPPPLVHTSQGVGDMAHWLIDLFAPPRFDFSSKPGWVLNDADYPMPDNQA